MAAWSLVNRGACCLEVSTIALAKEGVETETGEGAAPDTFRASIVAPVLDRTSLMPGETGLFCAG